MAPKPEAFLSRIASDHAPNITSRPRKLTNYQEILILFSKWKKKIKMWKGISCLFLGRRDADAGESDAAAVVRASNNIMSLGPANLIPKGRRQHVICEWKPWCSGLVWLVAFVYNDACVMLSQSDCIIATTGTSAYNKPHTNKLFGWIGKIRSYFYMHACSVKRPCPWYKTVHLDHFKPSYLRMWFMRSRVHPWHSADFGGLFKFARKGKKPEVTLLYCGQRQQMFLIHTSCVDHLDSLVNL